MAMRTKAVECRAKTVQQGQRHTNAPQYQEPHQCTLATADQQSCTTTQSSKHARESRQACKEDAWSKHARNQNEAVQTACLFFRMRVAMFRCALRVVSSPAAASPRPTSREDNDPRGDLLSISRTALISTASPSSPSSPSSPPP
eukprot:6182463-Pleurochrysis_carterae.AAC.4